MYTQAYTLIEFSEPALARIRALRLSGFLCRQTKHCAGFQFVSTHAQRSLT